MWRYQRSTAGRAEGWTAMAIRDEALMSKCYLQGTVRLGTGRALRSVEVFGLLQGLVKKGFDKSGDAIIMRKTSQQRFSRGRYACVHADAYLWGRAMRGFLSACISCSIVGDKPPFAQSDLSLCPTPRIASFEMFGLGHDECNFSPRSTPEAFHPSGHSSISGLGYFHQGHLHKNGCPCALS